MLSINSSEGPSLMSSRCNVWVTRILQIYTIVYMLKDRSFLVGLYFMRCHIVAALPKRSGKTV